MIDCVSLVQSNHLSFQTKPPFVFVSLFHFLLQSPYVEFKSYDYNHVPVRRVLGCETMWRLNTWRGQNWNDTKNCSCFFVMTRENYEKKFRVGANGPQKQDLSYAISLVSQIFRKIKETSNVSVSKAQHCLPRCTKTSWETRFWWLFEAIIKTYHPFDSQWCGQDNRLITWLLLLSKSVRTFSIKFIVLNRCFSEHSQLWKVFLPV